MKTEIFLKSLTITATKKATMLAIALSQKTNNSLGNFHIGDY